MKHFLKWDDWRLNMFGIKAVAKISLKEQLIRYGIFPMN